MADADFNIAVPGRLLKPGEIRVVGRPSGSSNALLTDRPAYKSLSQPPNDHQYTNLPKSVPLSNSLESQYSLSSLPSRHVNSFNTTSDLWRQGVLQSDNEAFANRNFSRAPGPPSDNPPLPSPNSPESHYRSYAAAADLYSPKTTLRLFNSVTTQTERSPLEEKFLFRESILFGCDLVTELAQKLPSVAEVREYADFVRDKTIQSRAQNICSRMASGATEHNIVSEYVKTFIKIADSWLDARNCFGLADQCCRKSCSLDSRELSANYIEWMHSARRLLDSIVNGLEKVNRESLLTCMLSHSLGDVAVNEDLPQPSASFNSFPGGSWGYPTNPPYHCAPMTNPTMPMDALANIRPPGFPMQRDTPTWYHNQPPYSDPPIVYPNIDCLGSTSDYLKPSSYDVPRKNMTTTKKRNNISKAKSDAFQDTSLIRGYVVALPNTGIKRDVESDQGDSESSKEAVKIELQKSPLKITRELIMGQFDSDGKKLHLMKPGDLEDSESASDGNLEDQLYSPFPAKQKNVKNVWPKRRCAISQAQEKRIQEITNCLSKFDFPECVMYAEDPELFKVVKQPIFMENICNKVKNKVYETVEQFVYDCRRFFLIAALFCQKNEQEKEKMATFGAEFENMLEVNFENVLNWRHISGDWREANYYPELRYIRKKSKPPKNETPSNVDTQK